MAKAARDEILITPEMVAAGVEVVLAWQQSDHYVEADLVTQVFLAMHSRLPEHNPQQDGQVRKRVGKSRYTT